MIVAVQGFSGSGFKGWGNRKLGIVELKGIEKWPLHLKIMVTTWAVVFVEQFVTR